MSRHHPDEGGRYCIRHCPESCPDFQILSLSTIDRYGVGTYVSGVKHGPQAAQCLGCTSAKKTSRGDPELKLNTVPGPGKLPGFFCSKYTSNRRGMKHSRARLANHSRRVPRAHPHPSDHRGVRHLPLDAARQPSVRCALELRASGAGSGLEAVADALMDGGPGSSVSHFVTALMAVVPTSILAESTYLPIR